MQHQGRWRVPMTGEWVSDFELTAELPSVATPVAD